MHKLQEFLYVTQYMGKIAKPHTPSLTKINSAKLPNTALDLKKKRHSGNKWSWTHSNFAVNGTTVIITSNIEMDFPSVLTACYVTDFTAGNIGTDSPSNLTPNGFASIITTDDIDTVGSLDMATTSAITFPLPLS